MPIKFLKCLLSTDPVCFQAWSLAIQCPLCSMTFSDQSAMSAHCDMAHDQSKTECATMLQPTHPHAMTESDSLGEKGQSSTVDDVNPNQCVICFKVCQTKLHLAQHLTLMHGAGKNYQCKVCFKNYKSNGHLKSHTSSVHGIGEIKTFQCSLCPKAFRTKSKLTYHRSTEHRRGNVKKFRCDVCPKVCCTKAHLVYHKSSKHGVGDVSTFLCEICSKVYKSKGGLQYHMSAAH